MSQIGVDQWVEQSDERRDRYSGWTAPARRAFDKLPTGWKLVGVLGAAAAFPLLVPQGEIRIGITVLLLAMLALGLNVVVGWAGLLDLGFVAFYGFGAYFYAIVASDQLPAHWPTWVAIPIIVAAAALLGALLSLPSRRLVGDYLAIMTLFFAQIFVELVRNFERLPFVSEDLDLTGGPNGIPGVEAWDLFGFQINSFKRHYYLLLILLVVLIAGLHNLNASRTGRAWRALREDTLAAEHMTTPVNKLKLLAFVVGAAIAGLAGSIFAAVQVGVFPNNFALPFLITIYAAVILGGSGSIAGVVLGAVAIGYIPELLRDPGKAGWLFYIGLAVMLVVTMKRWQPIAAVTIGLVVFGFVVRFVSSAIWDESIMGTANDTFISRFVDGWVLILGEQQDLITNYAFVVAIAGVLLVVVTRGWLRIATLIPTIYLAILVWENKLALQ
ncbi:MAG TPA: branched-chain amino acid ABC transporter permease, partial [Actinobacteria bacterium]|nr:branched-chain amino acid ABC transporter permease [Actinomycetota bacterium]